jgi:ribonuclease HI
MELYAAFVALRTLERPTVVEVYTDSRYVQDGISKWIYSWQKKGWRTSNNKPVLHEDLWRELIKLDREHTVDWKWVQGHASDKFNNFVDLLAKRAILKREGTDVKLYLSELEEKLAAGQIAF